MYMPPLYDHGQLARGNYLSRASGHIQMSCHIHIITWYVHIQFNALDIIPSYLQSIFAISNIIFYIYI